MKGMIFGGCSFTWGQGLYYYSELPNIIRMSDGEFHQSKLTDAQIKYKNTLYFPRLVANHFNTFEIVRPQNGGSDDNTMVFIDDLFTEKSNLGKINHDDIEYIIFQTSDIGRNKFEFEHGGRKYQMNPRKNYPTYEENDKIFTEWLIHNDITYDEWFSSFKQQIFYKLKTFIKKYEDLNIKVKIVCWKDDLLKLINDDIEMSKKLVILEYENKQYKCIDYLTKMNYGLLISNDDLDLKNPPHDHHPSKKCHEIIANSIIKNIEKDLI